MSSHTHKHTQNTYASLQSIFLSCLLTFSPLCPRLPCSVSHPLSPHLHLFPFPPPPFHFLSLFLAHTLTLVLFSGVTTCLAHLAACVRACVSLRLCVSLYVCACAHLHVWCVCSYTAVLVHLGKRVNVCESWREGGSGGRWQWQEQTETEAVVFTQHEDQSHINPKVINLTFCSTATLLTITHWASKQHTSIIISTSKQHSVPL